MYIKYTFVRLTYLLIFYKFVLNIDPFPIQMGYLIYFTSALLYNLLLCPHGYIQLGFCVRFLWLLPNGSLRAEICWVGIG
jgi:MFS superfamily sulfate permease-like transporter